MVSETAGLLDPTQTSSRLPPLHYRTFDSSLADSHKNAFTQRYSRFSPSTESPDSPEPCSSYSPANSHEIYGALSSESDKIYVMPPPDITSTYEIANSHSNYEIFNDHFNMCDDNEIPEMTLNEPKNIGNSDDMDSKRVRINDSAYDIEQCLMEIEESLLNIEQNLIYVQDLEIPQLNNLLQSTIDKKCGDEWPSFVCKSKSMVFSNEQTSVSNGDSDEGENISLIASLDNLPTRQCGNRNSDSTRSLRDTRHRSVNFNSHGDVRKCEEGRRNFHRRRKNSLDVEAFKRRRKTSLDHCYFSKNNGGSGGYRKASSHGALEMFAKEKKRRVSGGTSIKSNDCIFNEINERARDCRRKFDNICTAKSDNTANHIDVKIDESMGKKNYPRVNSLPNPDNALVPGKLISLSFSLLLAALLQAVRCLADLVEDTFRSVALDKYALQD
ncbi:uncharacterized protein LOC107037635 [Diachasma alloeum]|uniref:uncharacterized protein LOC107037635 n=1 Tax=Diachasma alloeum TaxID=454923 RepID=UPI0007384E29|nr:uncharacterized protein LOC107037635 [Diachasma alloeum]